MIFRRLKINVQKFAKQPDTVVFKSVLLTTRVQRGLVKNCGKKTPFLTLFGNFAVYLLRDFVKSVKSDHFVNAFPPQFSGLLGLPKTSRLRHTLGIQPLYPRDFESKGPPPIDFWLVYYSCEKKTKKSTFWTMCPPV